MPFEIYVERDNIYGISYDISYDVPERPHFKNVHKNNRQFT